jgi:hypothetical protein
MIYIITDNQIPELDSDIINNDKIKIIDHKQILPIDILPVFYSDVIESYLHNIPNLSEIFIYNNDDCFFMDYITPNDIIDNIKLKIVNNFNIDIIKTKTSEYSKRIIFTYDILQNIGCNKLINNHHTKILRKSTMKKIEYEYSDLLTELRKHRFRNIYSIQYLFFVINIDNLLYDNIILENTNNCIEYHFGNYNYSDRFANKFIFYKIKYACYNSMNNTFTSKFLELINNVLNFNQ